MSRRDLLTVGASIASGAALAAASVRWRAPRPPGQVALWVADRAGHMVFGLSADLMVVLRACVRAPISLTAVAEGCLVEHVPSGGPESATQWLRLRVDGSMEPAPPGPSQRRRDDAAAGLRRDASRSAEWRFAEVDDAVMASLTGWSSRFLERWVTLPSGAQRRAFRFRLPWTARALAVDRDGVWVAADRWCAIGHFSHTGIERWRAEFEDADGVEALVPDGHGGVFAACAGALVRLSARGMRLPAQGGFCHLVSLARADRTYVSRSR